MIRCFRMKSMPDTLKTIEKKSLKPSVFSQKFEAKCFLAKKKVAGSSANAVHSAVFLSV